MINLASKYIRQIFNKQGMGLPIKLGDQPSIKENIVLFQQMDGKQREDLVFLAVGALLLKQSNSQLQPSDDPKMLRKQLESLGYLKTRSEMEQFILPKDYDDLVMRAIDALSIHIVNLLGKEKPSEHSYTTSGLPFDPDLASKSSFQDRSLFYDILAKEHSLIFPERSFLRDHTVVFSGCSNQATRIKLIAEAKEVALSNSEFSTIAYDIDPYEMKYGYAAGIALGVSAEEMPIFQANALAYLDARKQFRIQTNSIMTVSMLSSIFSFNQFEKHISVSAASMQSGDHLALFHPKLSENFLEMVEIMPHVGSEKKGYISILINNKVSQSGYNSERVIEFGEKNGLKPIKTEENHTHGCVIFGK